MRKNGGRMSKGSQGGPISSKKGPWTDAEDAILTDYVRNHGEGNWNVIQSHTGLARCGKSCRLRWVNHLRPDLRKGAFTQEEERRIVELQALLGNKWARIAQEFPGRTDNEIKNFWNTRCKRLERAGKPIYPEDLCQQIQNAAQSAQNMIGSSADGDAFSNDPSNSDSFEVPKFDKFDLSREISSYMPMPMPPSGPRDTVSPHNAYNRISPSLRTHNWIQVPQASYLDNDGLPCADYGFEIVGDNQFGATDPGYISDLSIPDQQGNYNTLPGCHDGFPARDVGLPESLVGLVEDDTFLTEMYASLNGDNPYCYSPSSRPVPTGSKLELPSFQNRDSQQDGSVRESTPLNPLLSHKSTGTLIQNPIYDQAQSDRPLPRNSGLLDAMFSGPTTLNDCLNATDPLSALRLESHDLIPPLVAPIGGSSSEPTPTADSFDCLPDLGDWSSPDEMNTTARFD